MQTSIATGPKDMVLGQAATLIRKSIGALTRLANRRPRPCPTISGPKLSGLTLIFTRTTPTFLLGNYLGLPLALSFLLANSYGRDILRRWASSDARSPDDAVMKEAGDAARDNIILATQNQGSSGIRYASERGSFLGKRLGFPSSFLV